MKQALYSQLQKIKDSEIRSFVIQALNNAPEEFWHGACSTTGKFHPPENQGTQEL